MSFVRIDGTKPQLNTRPGHRSFIHRLMSEGVTMGRLDTLDCLGLSCALVLPRTKSSQGYSACSQALE